MAWVLRTPQIHNSFSDLGYALPDGYHINDNCNSALESILQNLVTEDKNLRTYRRSISFGQNIKKDLIPILITTKDDNTVELLIKILVNLTIPVECLLSLELMSRTDSGRHAIFEINSMLSSTKIALTDHRVTKVIIDFLKKNAKNEQKTKLSIEQCTNISNTLLFLRNILHIPEDITCHSGPPHTIHNQLLWNLFSHSIDKVLIKLMTIPDAINWGVTMVQLIALFYKDQHVTTLHKLLNLWLEASICESSEDNESNTSPPNRCSDDSSPMVTSDPTSDSSDTGANRNSNGTLNLVNNCWNLTSIKGENGKQNFQPQNTANSKNSSQGGRSQLVDDRRKSCEKGNNYMKEATNTTAVTKNNIRKVRISENSDCGYGTQVDNQASLSTSSAEDELPAKKHQKPHTPKQRVINKVWPSATPQDRRRKKLVKRGKANITNVQGLLHYMPTDDDISNVLKEFTVDFLLKGYNSLVRTLHSQILTNAHLEIDTSHFFWLVTYFLKFATQIELDLEHVCCILSFEIVSYLTAEAVNLCEQFELAIKLDGNDLKPSIRRLHLVVTAIREFIQAIETYKKSAQICNNDKELLDKLQLKMCETDELRLLLVLLLRNFNPKYQTKQYLQDLVVTNHNLLVLTDATMKLPEYKGTGTMADHLRQFCAPEMMYQYSLLLDDYKVNGEFVNDCIFTLMHHVGGDMGSAISLFQPNIVKTFKAILKSDFEICDDWSDLIDYVMNKYVKKPLKIRSALLRSLGINIFGDDTRFQKTLVIVERTDELMPSGGAGEPEKVLPQEKKSVEPYNSNSWTEDEISSLSWNYMQCNDLPDVVGEIVKMFKENGIIKDRGSVIKELYNQYVINKDQFDELSKKESSKTMQEIKETRENEIGKLCEQLKQDGKSKLLDWVQTVILETCAAKIYLQKLTSETVNPESASKVHPLEFLLRKPKDIPVISSVSYHSLLLSRSIPLVPWNCEQASICKDLKFLQLSHRLGFQMPVDTGKVFIRIPHIWTPDLLYEVAAKISPVDSSKLKFSLNDISQTSILNSGEASNFILPELAKSNDLSPTPENFYQINNKKQNHFASIVNFTPTPGSSFTTTDDNVDTPNWLELVQKAQEYKINLDLDKSIIGVKEDTVMQQMDVERVRVSRAAAMCEVPIVLPPEPMTLMMSCMSVTQETMNFPINSPQSVYCNASASDTASVASDLTRMYVSDEDEKPEPLLCVKRTLKSARIATKPTDVFCAQGSIEPGCCVPEKRPRVEFLTPF